MKWFRKAVLIIHGFAGGTYDEDYLFHHLQVISRYDVYNFTLPGHDGRTNNIRYQNWIKRSENEIEYLLKNGYRHIYVIGHSMGGVIATYLASKYPQIEKLVLVAPAFTYVGMEHNQFSAKSFVKKTEKIFQQYGINYMKNWLMRVPTTFVFEFMVLVDKYQDVGKNVNIPTLIIRGTSDMVVSEEAVDHVYGEINNNYKKIVHLKGTTHDVFRENKKEEVTLMIIDFFKNKKNILKFEDVNKDVIKEII